MTRLNAFAIKMIHIAKSNLHLDEDTYRDILQQRYNKKSSNLLNYSEYQDLMNLFKAMGFVPKPRLGTAKGGTKKQVKEVWRLVEEHKVDKKRLIGIIKYITNIDASEDEPLKWLGRKELSNLIQALRRWKWDSPLKKNN